MTACLLAICVLCALATGCAMAQRLQGAQGTLRIGALNKISGVYFDDHGRSTN